MKKLLGKQGGFTLVELLVVVGIIVGLAAVIVPAVTRFASSGDDAAQKAEKDNVQAAFDSLMADANISTVDTRSTLAAVQAWAGLPVRGGAAIVAQGAPVDLTDYMRDTTTKYWYCWDGSGLVTQLTAAGACP